MYTVIQVSSCFRKPLRNSLYKNYINILHSLQCFYKSTISSHANVYQQSAVIYHVMLMCIPVLRTTHVVLYGYDMLFQGS